MPTSFCWLNSKKHIYDMTWYRTWVLFHLGLKNLSESDERIRGSVGLIQCTFMLLNLHNNIVNKQWFPVWTEQFMQCSLSCRGFGCFVLCHCVKFYLHWHYAMFFELLWVWVVFCSMPLCSIPSTLTLINHLLALLIFNSFWFIFWLFT